MAEMGLLSLLHSSEAECMMREFVASAFYVSGALFDEYSFWLWIPTSAYTIPVTLGDNNQQLSLQIDTGSSDLVSFLAFL